MSGAAGRRPGSVRLVRLGRGAEYAPHGLVLAALVVLGPLVVLACALAAGSSLPWWVLLVAPLLLLVVPRAGTLLPGLVDLVLLLAWIATVPGPVTWWSLPAGVGLLLAHLAAAALASTPTTLRWADATVRRWGRRTGVVVLVTAAVAAAVDAVHRLRPPGTVVVGVLALLLAAAWPWLVRTPDRDDPA